MQAPEFWHRPGPLPLLLQPLAAAYGTLGRLHRHLVRSQRVGVPVICIGNLVAGGAGKTPVALAVIAALQQRRHSVHALLRGYGGRQRGPLRVDPEHHSAADVGDEALLLARRAPTWVAAERPAGARAAVADGAGVIVMDDGFQNPHLHKDLSLLVIDGDYGFGNGRLLPAGPLRENLANGLARADAIVLIGDDTQGVARRLPDDRPRLAARLLPDPDAPDLGGQRVLAFAGIGRPAKFFDSLRAAGADLVETRALPDHHAYDEREIDALCQRAETLDAVPVTTEKDAVRLPPRHRGRITAYPVTLVWQDPRLLQDQLERVVADG